MSTLRTAFLMSTAIAAFAAAMPAAAQTASRNAAAPAEATSGSDNDIVVTAQKRTQTLIDVPQSVTVVSGAELEQQHATNFSDYLKLVPGLQLSQSSPGQGRLVIRGINTDGVASTVAVYEDETPFGSSTGLVNGGVLAGDLDTFDVARIEVLRGPQGTLYGASSLGGVLKFVTNAPDTEHLVARARGGVETTEGGGISYYGNAVINIPLSANLAFRASGSYRNEGGWIDSIGTGGSQVRNNVNGSRNYGGRASLLFAPSPSVSVRLSALFQNLETDAPSVVESNPTTLATLYGRQTQSIFVTPFKNVDYRVYNGTADVDLGLAKLTSSTSYSTQKQTFRADETFPLSGLIQQFFGVTNQLYESQNTNVEKITQELRLASSKSPLLDWVIGGYYDHEKGLLYQDYVGVTPGTLTPITALGILARSNLSSRYEEFAGFANATLHLGQRFDIDFGGRYSHNDQSSSQVTTGPLAGEQNVSQTSSDNVFTYSAAPKIKFGPNAALYARVAKGFRPGGPNALAPGAPASVATFQSDSVVSYEAGLKYQTEDRTLSFDLATFHIDWDRIQLIAQIALPAGNFNVNTNGRTAKSDGVEFTATLRPTKGFDVSINGAYTNARLTADTTVITNGVAGANLVGGRDGDKLPYTPKYSVNVNGDYRWALGSATTASLGGSLRFLSKQNAGFNNAFRVANGRQRQIASYDVVDLHAGLDFTRFSVDVYAKNVGNSDGKQSVGGLGNFPNGSIDTGVIRPRTIGLSITASY